jgi:hypothetical protein
MFLILITDSLEPIKALQNRTNDKAAKEFLKIQKKKFEDSQAIKVK